MMGSADAVSVQYRLVISKSDERIAGPDDADVVFMVPVEGLDGVDASVAFMRGKLKATGDTGEIIDLLFSGAADRAFSELRP